MKHILDAAKAKKAAKVEDTFEDLFSKMNLIDDVFCNCSRKCATKKCACVQNKKHCGAMCHKMNNSCMNRGTDRYQ